MGISKGIVWRKRIFSVSLRSKIVGTFVIVSLTRSDDQRYVVYILE